jgi:carrier protein
MDRVAQCALGAGVSTFFHPLAYSKILIQIGYEPLSPVPSTTIFGSKVLMYPNIFKYMGHIRKTDGFFGLYRGLGAKLASGIICNYVSNAVQASLTELPLGANQAGTAAEEDDNGQTGTTVTVYKLLTATSFETISRSAGIIVSHPFHVIFVRSVAQFIGRETAYNSIWSSTVEIYEKQGILGFFSGLVPRLIGEILTVWMANLLAHVLNTFLVSTQPASTAKEMKGYTNMASQLIVTQLTYPFNLVSNVMCLNNCGLTAGGPPITPIYSDWLDSWSRLSAEGQIKRGSSIFYRLYRGPVSYGRDGIMMPAVTKQY